MTDITINNSSTVDDRKGEQQQQQQSPPSPRTHSKMIVARIYADDPTLTALDLTAALLTTGGDTALSTISDALNCSTHLKQLTLSDNGITDVGAALLADALADGNAAKGLTKVVLDGNRIGTEGVNALVLALRQTPKTILVSLERNEAHVDESAMYQLQTMVQLNDQPGRLRQVVLDLIAENEVIRLREQLHQDQYQLQLARIRAQEDGAAAAVAVASASASATGQSNRRQSRASNIGVPSFVNHHDEDFEGDNAGSKNRQRVLTQLLQQQQNLKNSGAEWKTKTLELDLSMAYARWIPPASSSASNIGGGSSRLGYSALFQQFLEILCTILQTNKVLLKLSLAGNFIDDEGAKTIAHMLSRNCHLDELILDNNSITDFGAQLLCDAFHNNNTLCVLSLLRNNSISPQRIFDIEAAQALNRQPLYLKRWYHELLADDPSVPESLVFDNRQSLKKYDDVGIRLMCVALEKNTRVKELTIVNAYVTDTGCLCIRDLLRRNKNLRKLAMNECKSIGVSGVGRICDMLSVNNTIESLSLSDCDLDDEGALTIAAAVEQHPSLTELDVSHNKRIISSASAIATVFAHNYRLKNVNVEGTSCTESVKTAVNVRQKASAQPERLRALFGSLISNHWELSSVLLRPSKLEDTPLDDTAIEMLSQALIDNTKVTHLDISGNHVTLAGAKEVYRMLRLNRSTMRTLKMSDNRIDFGIQHAKLVAAVLGLHTTLHSIDISNTGMDDAGVEFILSEVETFSNRIPVRTIDVSNNRLVSPASNSRLQLILRAHALHPIVKRRFRGVHREWLLSDDERAPFRALKMGHVFDHASDYFDLAPPTDEDRIGCIAIALDFVRGHAFRTVKEIDVSGNLCTDVGIKLVADYVCWAATQRHILIESVNASENALTDAGVLDHLCRAAIKCESIRSILASGNGTALGGSVTDNALAELQARVSFNLQPEEMRRLIKHAEEGVTTDGVDQAGEINESNRAEHHVNDTHVSLLVRALLRKGAADVHTVNLSNNHVTLAALNALGQLAAERPAFKKIVLRNTMIRATTKAEAAPLVGYLLKTQLVHVDLSHNEFQDEFAEALLPALRASKTLTFFCMNNSGLSAPVELAVASSVSLNALSNNLSSAGVVFGSMSHVLRDRTAAAASLGGDGGARRVSGGGGSGGGGDAVSNGESGASSSLWTKPTDEEEEEEGENDGCVYLDGGDDDTSTSLTATSASLSQLGDSSVGSSLFSKNSKRKRRSGGGGGGGGNNNRRHIAISSDILTATHLKLGSSTLDERQIAEIVRMTRRNGTVTSIDVSCNRLQDEPLSQIVLLLVGYSSLRMLSVAGNAVGIHTVSKLKALVQHQLCRLRELDLSNALPRRAADVEQALEAFLATAYERSHTLWRVKFDGCESHISEESARALTKLRLNRQLELKRVLPLVLANEPSLTKISALADPNQDDRNMIDDVGVKFLCEALLHNTHVQCIELRIAAVTEAGVRCFEPVLATSVAVTSLSLVGSRVLQDGRCFSDLAKVSKGLMELNIDDNTLLPPHSLQELASALGLRRKMRKASVSGCGTHRQQLLHRELEAAKKAFISNHMSFALEHGDVDLFRADGEIKRLEEEMKEAAIRHRKYEMELAAAVESVAQALFFNGHALTLADFFEQESQEQVIAARKAREARRAAGEVVTMNPEHVRREQEEQRERERLERQGMEKDLDMVERMAEDVISMSAVRRREAENAKKCAGLRQYVYQEVGEPIPGPLFSEPAVLTRLDLSRPQAYCQGNNMATVRQHHANQQHSAAPSSSPSVFAAVSASSNLPAFEEHFIGDAAVQMLCKLLAVNDTVIHLSLARQELTALSSMAIAEMLHKNRFIEQIDLSGNCLHDSVHQLCDALVSNPRVWHIDISDNGTTEVLESRISTLCRTNLEPLVFKELLVMIFERRAEPRQVDLHFDGDRDEPAIQESRKKTLKEFPFKKERVDDVSAEMLCNCGLAKCVSVRYLDVSRTDISDVGMSHFLRTLTESRTIVKIQASGVKNITDVAGQLLAQAWRDIPTLFEIDISGADMARISDVTVQCAIESACLRHKCTEFLVDGCPNVTQRAREKLYMLCHINRVFGKADARVELVECCMGIPSRKEVHLDSLVGKGLKSKAALKAICTCVPMSRHVTHLTLDLNDLTDADLAPIVECVKQCVGLEMLSLGSNRFVDVAPLCHALAPWMLEDEGGGDAATTLSTAPLQKAAVAAAAAAAAADQKNKNSKFVDGSDASAVISSARGEREQRRPSRAALAVASSSHEQQYQQSQQQERPRKQSAAAAAAAAAAEVAYRNRIIDHDDDDGSGEDDEGSSTPGTAGSQQQRRQRKSINSLRLHAYRLQKYAGKYAANVKSLHLHKNNLSVASAFAIADMLRSSDNLTELDVSDNPWGRLGARVLVSSLLVNGGLKRILLDGEGVPKTLIAQAESALHCNLREQKREA